MDETGQDTKGELFIVTVILPEKRDELKAYVTHVEHVSGKGKFKWGRVEPDYRYRYLHELFTQKTYPFTACYAIHERTDAYKEATIQTISASIHTVDDFKNCAFTILVDGLNEKDQRYYGYALRHQGIPSKKVRGIKKDENDALIRLADSICGFVRDIQTDEITEERFIRLFRKAKTSGVLVELSPKKTPVGRGNSLFR